MITLTRPRQTTRRHKPIRDILPEFHKQTSSNEVRDRYFLIMGREASKQAAHDAAILGLVRDNTLYHDAAIQNYSAPVNSPLNAHVHTPLGFTLLPTNYGQDLTIGQR